MGLTEFRKEYPEYNDWDDERLTKGLHKKYGEGYTYDNFARKIGADNAVDWRTSHEKRMQTGEVETTFNYIPAVGETPYDDIFTEHNKQYNIPINILKRQMLAESAGNPDAVSKVGAQGLMQIMPKTQKELGVTNPFDVEQSISGGMKYMR